MSKTALLYVNKLFKDFASKECKYLDMVNIKDDNWLPLNDYTEKDGKIVNPALNGTLDQLWSKIKQHNIPTCKLQRTGSYAFHQISWPNVKYDRDSYPEWIQYNDDDGTPLMRYNSDGIEAARKKQFEYGKKVATTFLRQNLPQLVEDVLEKSSMSSTFFLF